MFERFSRRKSVEGVSGTQAVARNGQSAQHQYAGVGAAQSAAATRPEAPAAGGGPHDTGTQVLPPRGRPVPPAPAVGDMRERQRVEFGGTSWGSAFFGWLVALGLSALLVGLLSAAGAAIGLTEGVSPRDAVDQADTVGIVGGALLLLALLIAYYAGGYVAGRMSRFDGVRQGVAVWLVGLLVTLVLAIGGVLLGSEYNVFQQLDLPRIPVDEGTLTTGGLIALGAVLLGTLLAAMAGGRAGERFHVRVDRFGLDRDRL
jgi:hypothetical protein